MESKRAPSPGAGVIGGSDLPSKSAVVLWKSRQVLLTTEPSSACCFVLKIRICVSLAGLELDV